MILGISGRIGSGKDLVGTIIQYLMYDKKMRDKRIGYGIPSYFYSDEVFIEELLEDSKLFKVSDPDILWKIVKFADKLKDCMCLILGCIRDQWENDREFRDKELGEEWDRYIVEYNDFEYYGEAYYETLEEANFDSISIKEIYNNVSEPKLIKMTPRKFIQLLGTNCGRNIIHPNIWINATMSDYRPYGYEKGSNKNIADVLEDKHFGTLNYPNWIITDVRFPNEVKAIKDKDGIIIKIQRQKKKIITGNITKDIINNTKNFGIVEHESETALDNYKDFDYTINNDGSIQDLINEVRIILIKEDLL